MPGFVKRIIGLLLTVTLLVFVYEYHYYSKTVATTGKIEAITHKGRGQEMSIGFATASGGRAAFASAILLFDELSGKFHVGDRVPVAYCSDCYPIAKVGLWAYLYTLTIMLVALDLMVVVVLVVAGRRRRQAGT